MEMLANIARIRQLEEENARLRNENALLHHIQNNKSRVTIGCQTSSNLEFNTVTVSNSKIKNLFQFYTGLTFVRFVMLLGFLFPADTCTKKNPIVYGEKRKETHFDRFPLSEQMFMYLCRLRNGLSLKDLAYRFNVKVQTVSTVINGVAKYMYGRLGSLSFWPHRNVIIENMTEAYKQDFPSCLAILDCTELKTEKPSSLKQQSQCYSDYKSSNTLKDLVLCDPRGSILFVSDLFSGSISDNDIIKKSGFLDYLLNLKERGFIKKK